jgi:hypothetical protein
VEAHDTKGTSDSKKEIIIGAKRQMAQITQSAYLIHHIVSSRINSKQKQDSKHFEEFLLSKSPKYGKTEYGNFHTFCKFSLSLDQVIVLVS